jgi:hypothetical protein
MLLYSSTANPKLLSAEQFTDHFLWNVKKIQQNFPLSHQRHYTRTFSFSRYNKAVCVNFPRIPAVALAFVFLSNLAIVLL